MARVANYEHSLVFDKMKHIRERIPNNYTSLQYLRTLDYFLWESVKPIALNCPSLFNNYLAKIVARQSLKASAKFTSDERHKVPITFFNTLMQSDDEKAFEASRKMYINRGLMFGFISLFLRMMEPYVKIQADRNNLLRHTYCERIENNSGLKPGALLYPALMNVRHWDERARNWKAMITEKYTRMALQQAQRTYTDYNHAVRLDDVVQIYLLTVNKAIDRCDARQGVLTTFIQSWFKSAKGEVAAMANANQDQSIESLVEDHGDAVHEVLGTTEPDQMMELWQHVAMVAAQIDPEGLVRTVMGIPQHVSSSERKLLEMFRCHT